MDTPDSLNGKVAIITGAARGIGLATSRLLLESGWRVAMVDRDQPALAEAFANLANLADVVETAAIAEQAQESTDGETDSVLAISCDVSVPEEVQQMVVKTVKKWGRIDALVNNAGVADFRPLEDTSYEIWRTVFATNLDGIFLCSQAVAAELKKSKGAIVNIASISGLRASTLRVAYGTSKAAVIHLTKQQAAELGEFQVRVNCVAPGPVKTKLSIAVHTQEIISAYHDAIPLNRYGGEKEIADVIVFLCSEKAAYVTGQIVAADGGFESTGVGLPALRATSDVTDA